MKYFSWREQFWYTDQPNGLQLTIPCLVVQGDEIDNENLPTLAKVRYIDNPFGSILWPADWSRHCDIDNKLNIKQILWKDKISDCVWRGSLTGVLSKYDRRYFCNLWQDKYDVAISTELSIEDLLKYKYQISIPGNDKASDLNWKLASNSVVLMAKPKIESWLMEGLLKPYIHYIPLKNDYSDLETIIEWCKNNDNKCQEITKNANLFMKQFDNIETEISIFQKVIKFYLNNIKFN